MNYTSKRIVCRRPLYLLVSFHCLDLLVSTFRPRFSLTLLFLLFAHRGQRTFHEGILKFARDFVAKMRNVTIKKKNLSSRKEIEKASRNFFKETTNRVNPWNISLHVEPAWKLFGSSSDLHFIHQNLRQEYDEEKKNQISRNYSG